MCLLIDVMNQVCGLQMQPICYNYVAGYYTLVTLLFVKKTLLTKCRDHKLRSFYWCYFHMVIFELVGRVAAQARNDS
jgi:hypothetical protein